MQNDQQAARKAAVYEAALQLIGQGVSPAALKIQQLADAAGIGKGTVYEYFSSKEEILQGLAEYCFARENERIRAMFADCTTLAGLEERITGYLQDIAASRMVYIEPGAKYYFDNGSEIENTFKDKNHTDKKECGWNQT